MSAATLDESVGLVDVELVMLIDGFEHVVIDAGAGSYINRRWPLLARSACVVKLSLFPALVFVTFMYKEMVTHHPTLTAEKLDYSGFTQLAVVHTANHSVVPYVSKALIKVDHVEVTLQVTTHRPSTTSSPLATSTTPTTADEPCHTAIKGEHCYHEVLWAYFSGINTHPEWYAGLTRQSSFEDFQALLHNRDKTECRKPCSTHTELPSNKPWGHPSLFCFAVAVGGELDLVRIQAQKKAGIFACDEMAVFSNGNVDVGLGVETIKIDVVQGGRSRDGTAANAQTFMNAWHALYGDKRFASHDFTVKVDPDSVLMPDRLRWHLAPHTGGKIYVTNCDLRDRYPGSQDFPMMYGALEVLSKDAVYTYIWGEERCKQMMPWWSYGEDLYMGHCLTNLGVQQVFDLGELSDMNCRGVDCHNGGAAAFHHFKTPADWLGCWEAAARP